METAWAWSPLLSSTISLTGWPLMPPCALTQLAQASIAGSPGSVNPPVPWV